MQEWLCWLEVRSHLPSKLVFVFVLITTDIVVYNYIFPEVSNTWVILSDYCILVLFGVFYWCNLNWLLLLVYISEAKKRTKKKTYLLLHEKFSLYFCILFSSDLHTLNMVNISSNACAWCARTNDVCVCMCVSSSVITLIREISGFRSLPSNLRKHIEMLSVYWLKDRVQIKSVMKIYLIV